MNQPATAQSLEPTSAQRQRHLARIVKVYPSAILRAYCRVRMLIIRQPFLNAIGQYLPARGDVLDIGRVNIGPQEFVIDDANQDRYERDESTIEAKRNDAAAFYGSVHLPQGATITRVVMVGTDNIGGAGNQIVLQLSRTRITPTTSGNPRPDHDILAVATSTNLDAVQEIADSTIECLDNPSDPTCPVVDNTQYAYNLIAQMQHIFPGSESLIRVYAAYIEYDLP